MKDIYIHFENYIEGMVRYYTEDRSIHIEYGISLENDL